jgi:rubrerythrin
MKTNLQEKTFEQIAIEAQEHLVLLKMCLYSRLSKEPISFYPKLTQSQAITEICKESGANSSVVIRTLLDIGIKAYMNINEHK